MRQDCWRVCRAGCRRRRRSPPKKRTCPAPWSPRASGRAASRSTRGPGALVWCCSCACVFLGCLRGGVALRRQMGQKINPQRVCVEGEQAAATHPLLASCRVRGKHDLAAVLEHLEDAQLPGSVFGGAEVSAHSRWMRATKPNPAYSSRAQSCAPQNSLARGSGGGRRGVNHAGGLHRISHCDFCGCAM